MLRRSLIWSKNSKVRFHAYLRENILSNSLNIQSSEARPEVIATSNKKQCKITTMNRNLNNLKGKIWRMHGNKRESPIKNMHLHPNIKEILSVNSPNNLSKSKGKNQKRLKSLKAKTDKALIQNKCFGNMDWNATLHMTKT